MPSMRSKVASASENGVLSLANLLCPELAGLQGVLSLLYALGPFSSRGAADLISSILMRNPSSFALKSVFLAAIGGLLVLSRSQF